MSGPVLVFRSNKPKPPGQAPLTSIARKAQLLRSLDAVAAGYVEELLDDLIPQFTQLGDNDGGGARDK